MNGWSIGCSVINSTLLGLFFFFLGVDRLAGRARPNTINIKIKVDYQSDMQGHNHWCSTIYRFHFLKVIENVQMKNKEKILILICIEPCHKPCCHSTMSTLQLGLNWNGKYNSTPPLYQQRMVEVDWAKKKKKRKEAKILLWSVFTYSTLLNPLYS